MFPDYGCTSIPIIKLSDFYVSSDAKRPCKAAPTSPVLPGGSGWWNSVSAQLGVFQGWRPRPYRTQWVCWLQLHISGGFFFRHSEIDIWSKNGHVLNCWYDWEQRDTGIPNLSGLRWGWKRTQMETTRWSLFKERAKPHRFLSSHVIPPYLTALHFLIPQTSWRHSGRHHHHCWKVWRIFFYMIYFAKPVSRILHISHLWSPI